MASQEQVIESLRQKSATVKLALTSTEGAKLLEILEQEFDNDQIVVPQDPHMTHYNLGRRDVVVYLKQLMRFDK